MVELWGIPCEVPSSTEHLALQRYPTLDGDATVPDGWFEDEQRWRAVAAEYRASGFVVVRQLMSAEDLAHLRSSVEDYIRDIVPTKDRAHVFLPEDGDLSTLQYFSSPHEHPHLDAFAQHPQWRHLAAVCLGEPFGDETEGSISGKGRPQIQYFNKVPCHSLPTPAHQDNFYFKLDPPNALTIWMAIDPIDVVNGLLHYVPGSHMEGVRPHMSSHVLGFSQSLKEWDGTAEQQREVPAALSLAPGDVIVHHCNTIHRAEPNNSSNPPRPRRAIAAVYAGASAVQDQTALREYIEDHDRQVAERGGNEDIMLANRQDGVALANQVRPAGKGIGARQPKL